MERASRGSVAPDAASDGQELSPYRLCSMMNSGEIWTDPEPGNRAPPADNTSLCCCCNVRLLGTLHSTGAPKTAPKPDTRKAATIYWKKDDNTSIIKKYS